MSLNITMAGDIYNSSGDIIDASLQIFVNNTNNGLTKWSDVFYTEDGSYNKNLGDASISSQDNTLGLTNASGEFILIAVWLDGDRTSTDNIPSEFAYIVQELKGEDVYVQDIKLNKPNSIECSDWTLTEKVNSGENIIALNNNTNEMSYTEFDIEHFLYQKYNNEIVFAFMGTNTVEYNFNDEGFISGNVYTTTNAGDITAQIKVMDYFGNEAICEKTASIYYVVETGFLDSTAPYSVGDEITIKSNPSGNIDQIINIEFLFYNETITAEEFTRLLETYGEIPVTQYITYFDGYQNITIEEQKTLAMDNIPPEMELKTLKEPDGTVENSEYIFVHNGKDTDGTIEKVEWQIWRNNPDINGNENWSLYYTTGPIPDLSDWTFDVKDLIGELKVRAIVYDNLGASVHEDFLIDASCDNLLISFDNIDWNKKINIIDFTLNIEKRTWENKIHKMVWDMTPKRMQWKNKPITVFWKTNVISREWKYKIYFDI